MREQRLCGCDRGGYSGGVGGDGYAAWVRVLASVCSFHLKNSEGARDG